MKVITSTNNELIKYLSSLSNKQNRIKEQKFIIEGHHLVEEAKKTNLLEMVISTDELYLKTFSKEETILVTDAIIKKLSSTKSPQNVIGVVKMMDNSLKSVENLLKKNNVRLIMLDDVNDPGNLGTIIRTTAALSYDALILSDNTVDLYNDKVIRSTQGVIFKIPVVKCDLNNAIKLLKENNIKCFGTSLTNSISISKVSKPEKFVLCFGNEANGVSKEVLDLMDCNIKIDMNNDVESLNVSIASGIIMYEFIK